MSMTPPKPPRKRPYQRHGLRALQTALKAVGDREGWLEALGEVGDALKAWRKDLVDDLGGEEAVSAQERAVVELAVKTYLLLESVDRWLLAQPSRVNKSRRQLFAVVLQRQQLVDSLARLLGQLGLERKAKPAPNLQDYIRARYGQGQEPEDGDRHGGQEPASEAEAPASPNSPGSAHTEVATPQKIARPGGAEGPAEAR